jgi:hypothetical protein
MRSLRPLTTFVAGSVLLAVAVATGAALVQPDMRNPRGVTICLVTGAILGMLIFGPIAAGDGLRSAFVRRHFHQFERWSVFILALGLGHWIGVGLGDHGITWAFAFVFLGACFRVYLSSLAKRPAT